MQYKKSKFAYFESSRAKSEKARLRSNIGISITKPPFSSQVPLKYNKLCCNAVVCFDFGGCETINVVGHKENFVFFL